jgi:putative transposase
VPARRCTVHEHRNLPAHAPEPLHEEVSADYTDMVHAATPKETEQRRRAFPRKRRLRCRAVADSLEEAGGRLFAFTRLPPAHSVEVGHPRPEPQLSRAPLRRVSRTGWSR